MIKNIYFILYSPKTHGCGVIYNLASLHCSKNVKIQPILALKTMFFYVETDGNKFFFTQTF